MAKRKEQPKPLLSVKHDFYDSLDALLNRALVLHQAVETALELDLIDARVAPKVKEALESFAAALMTGEQLEQST